MCSRVRRLDAVSPSQFAFRLALAALLVAGLGGCGEDAPGQMPGGDAEHGRALIEQYHCGSCHTVPGVPNSQGTVAVTLASFGVRSYIAGQLPNRDDILVRWIVDPASVLPTATMPSMGVSPGDARDIAAYLRGLR